MAERCILTAGPFDPSEELDVISASDGGHGAVASFTGVARDRAKDGEAVRALFLDHHPRLTLQSMEDIADAAEARFGITACRIVHRCGMVAASEPIVFVAATSAHRRAALDAVNYMMDRLKTDAMFWKREDFGAGSPEASQWIEPTEADHAARAGWDSGDGEGEE